MTACRLSICQSDANGILAYSIVPSPTECRHSAAGATNGSVWPMGWTSSAYWREMFVVGDAWWSSTKSRRVHTIQLPYRRRLRGRPIPATGAQWCATSPAAQIAEFLLANILGDVCLERRRTGLVFYKSRPDAAAPLRQKNRAQRAENRTLFHRFNPPIRTPHFKKQKNGISPNNT